MRTLFRWPKAILIVIAALAAPVASLVTAREQAANPLQGVWLFEKEVDTRADGSEVKLPMPRYDGILIYTADVGRPLTRRFEVEGDGLRLSGNFQHADEELTFTVYWQRAATKTAGG